MVRPLVSTQVTGVRFPLPALISLYGMLLAMSDKLREFQDALIVKNVVAKAFPSEDALKKYLQEHPGADKSKHHVEDAETSKLKKDLKNFQDIQKGQDRAEKKRDKRKEEKGKKEDEEYAAKLKKELTDWKDAK